MQILIAKPDLIFVGQEHGKQVSLPSEIKSSIDKYGAWYEGNGGDKIQGIKYQGSWDDKAAKDIKGYPPEFLFVIFTNTAVNKQKDIIVGDDLIFNQILKTQDKFGYFKDRKFDAQTLTKFLQSMGSDFLQTSKKPATEENVTKFLNNGEREMWESGKTNAKTMADNANKSRDLWLAKQNKGVYFVGSDHIKEIEKALKDKNINLDKQKTDLRKSERALLQEEAASEVSDMKCPEVLMDKDMSIINHRICIVKADLGPANPQAPEVMFWLMKSAKWNVSENAAREMLCSNCGHYWKTKFIDDCMKKYEQVTPPEVDPFWVDTGDGGGYCDEWDIPCTSSRTCDTWEPGGPITTAKAAMGDIEEEDEEDEGEDD